ncbi:hypothetical protein CSUB01_01261 [Colletotrichum sublineola]|uniref:Uncharacterized protein n=1 Tax=Colletotrichum sublineola TaxID=1173701 RepID=A0A066XI48_COLSU|nr:hypothetical protein CSUB01_01261 [Colletotrichum sublineola]
MAPKGDEDNRLTQILGKSKFITHVQIYTPDIRRGYLEPLHDLLHEMGWPELAQRVAQTWESSQTAESTELLSKEILRQVQQHPLSSTVTDESKRNGDDTKSVGRELSSTRAASPTKSETSSFHLSSDDESEYNAESRTTVVNVRIGTLQPVNVEDSFRLLHAASQVLISQVQLAAKFERGNTEERKIQLEKAELALREVKKAFEQTWTSIGGRKRKATEDLSNSPKRTPTSVTRSQASYDDTREDSNGLETGDRILSSKRPRIKRKKHKLTRLPSPSIENPLQLHPPPKTMEIAPPEIQTIASLFDSSGLSLIKKKLFALWSLEMWGRLGFDADNLFDMVASARLLQTSPGSASKRRHELDPFFRSEYHSKGASMADNENLASFINAKKRLLDYTGKPSLAWRILQLNTTVWLQLNFTFEEITNILKTMEIDAEKDENKAKGVLKVLDK